jgi:mannonate dehydratase
MHSRYDCLPILTEQLVDFIRCDITHIGGVSEARRIATIAEVFGIRTAWHGPGDIAPIAHAANVHVDVSIPNFGVQEMVHFPPAVHEVLPGAPEYRTAASGHRRARPRLRHRRSLAAKRYPYDPAYSRLPPRRRRACRCELGVGG